MAKKKEINALMKCKELTNPRISKDEIKNIILGDGHKFLGQRFVGFNGFDYLAYKTLVDEAA